MAPRGAGKLATCSLAVFSGESSWMKMTSNSCRKLSKEVVEDGDVIKSEKLAARGIRCTENPILRTTYWPKRSFVSKCLKPPAPVLTSNG